MPNYLSWQHKEALAFLWLAPILAVLVWYAAERRLAVLRAYLGEKYVAADWRWHRRRHLLKGALALAAFCLLVIAAARPRVGTEVQQVQRHGADVVLVIDTSDSMLAQDVKPSRLEAAKQAALALISRLEGDRIGVIVFAANAYMYSPLTIDHDAAAMFVSSISRGAAPSPGTSLEGALASAVRLLQKAEYHHKAIVLFSDGEDHPGFKPETLLQQARAQGITVHVVGVGGTEGEPIPVPDEPEGRAMRDPARLLDSFFGTAEPQGPRSRFKHDARGEVVLTRLNEKMLTSIARAGGGVLVKSSQSGINVDRIYQAISSMETATVGTYQFTQYAERYQWPLGFALLLLLIEGLVSEAPRARRVR